MMFVLFHTTYVEIYSNFCVYKRSSQFAFLISISCFYVQMHLAFVYVNIYLFSLGWDNRSSKKIAIYKKKKNTKKVFDRLSDDVDEYGFFL